MTNAKLMKKMATGAVVYGNDFHYQAGFFVVHNHVPGETVRENDGKKDALNAKPKKTEKTLTEKVRDTTVGEIIDTVMRKR